ncbi:MAG: hypothetical protein LUD27_08830 [Clostridia bacterium]|nr:hypothetical protein [Clostridia bacterium]
MANNGGGGGKFITGFLCFILGFIICIVAEIAVIGGGVYWLYSSDLESIFSTLGIENTEDDGSGNTKYIYVNTGDYATVSDLVSALMGLADKETSELRIDDIEDILPIADTLVDTVYETVASVLELDVDEVYAQIDEDTLKSTPFGELLDYVLDCVYGFEITVITNLANIDVESSKLYLALVYGSEAETVTVNGMPYVLFYDSFTYDESADTYSRFAYDDNRNEVYDGVTLSSAANSEYIDYLYSSTGSYKLYYYFADNGTAYVVTRDKGTFTPAETIGGEAVEYTITPLIPVCTGAYVAIEAGGYTTYYYISSARTIGDVVNGLDNVLYDIYITDLIEDETLNDIFDGISIGDLMNGGDIASTLMDNIYLTDFLGDDADDLLYDIFEGKSLGDIMNSDDVVNDLFGDVYVTDMLGDNPDQMMVDIFEGVTVSQLLNGEFEILLSDVLGDISVSSDSAAIMMYLSYGVSGLTDTNTTKTLNGETYSVYTATYNTLGTDDANGENDIYPVYVLVDDSGDIASVYTDDTYTTEITGTSVNDVSARMDGLMNDLTIGEITDLGTGALADKLSGYKISELSNLMDELYLSDVIEEVSTTGDSAAIMMYIVYGITGISGSCTEDAEGNYIFTATYHDYDGNSYDATVVTTKTQEDDGSGILVDVYTITKVTYDNAGVETAAVTKVNDVSARMDGMMTDLTIGEIAPSVANSSSPIAAKLADVTIDGLGDFLETLTLADAIGEVEIEGDSATIMMYVVYGISDLTENNGVYTATYNKYSDSDDNASYDGQTVYVNVETNSSGKEVITGVYADTAYTTEITGTPVNNVSDRMNGVMDILTLADVIDDVDSSSVIMTYLVYGLSDVDTTACTAVYHTYGADATEDPAYDYNGQTVYITVENGNITGVYADSGHTTALKATPVANASDRIDGVMNDLTIGDLVPSLANSTSNINKKIAASTINGITDVIDTLTIVDAIGDVSTEGDSAAIMMYLSYGISGLSETSIGTATVEGVTYNVYTAKYNSLGAEDTNSQSDIDTVYVLVDTDDDIYGVYTDNTYETAISATLINDVSGRIGGVMDDLTIGDLMDTSGSVFLNALSDSTISGLPDAISDLGIQEVFYENIYSTATALSSGSTTATLDNGTSVTIEEYKKVVYQSISSLSGTYYLYKTTTVIDKSTNTTSTSVTTSFVLYDNSGNDIEDYASGANDSSETISKVTTNIEYTVYWCASGGSTLYEVVYFNSAYLYFDSELDYVGTNGHLSAYSDFTSSANYTSGDILYTYGKAAGVWYFMVYNSNSGCKVKYSVDAMDSLIQNATTNIGDATLNDLFDAGILTDDSGNVSSNLDTTISQETLNAIYGTTSNPTPYSSDKTLGDLNISEAMDVLVYILNAYNTLLQSQTTP